MADLRAASDTACGTATSIPACLGPKRVTSDGVPHGDYITYHPNGETAIEGVFEDGVRAGLWRFYDEQGVQIRAVAGVEL